MKNQLKYLAAVGILLLVGAGCGRSAKLPAGDESAGRPGTNQDQPSGAKDETDKTVDEILDAATSEAALEDEAAKDAEDVSADQDEINSLQNAAYDAE